MVIEIRGVENGKLAVPVNSTLVHHTASLATDTRPCVLILAYLHTYIYIYIYMYYLLISQYGVFEDEMVGSCVCTDIK